jgi:hypothetical protein
MQETATAIDQFMYNLLLAIPGGASTTLMNDLKQLAEPKKSIVAHRPINFVPEKRAIVVGDYKAPHPFEPKEENVRKDLSSQSGPINYLSETTLTTLVPSVVSCPQNIGIKAAMEMAKTKQ